MTPVMAIWSRGQKKANSKKKVLTESVNTAVFNEKFQINTTLETDDNGNYKKKKSLISVASSKEKGILGKVELDLSQFKTNDFNEFKLFLENC